MSKIDCHLDHVLDLTTFVLSGETTPKELLDTLHTFYQQPTRYMLWDIRKAVLNQVNKDDLKNIILATKRFAESRVGGKTALVAETDLQFGLARMYSTFAELENHPIGISVFRDPQTAIDWIKSS